MKPQRFVRVNMPLSCKAVSISMRANASSGFGSRWSSQWCRRTTWGGEGYSIPGVESPFNSVWIQQGQRLLLDCDVRIYMLIVQVSGRTTVG